MMIFSVQVMKFENAASGDVGGLIVFTEKVIFES